MSLTVLDPLTLIDQYGADALRFTLALAAGQGRDMRIGPSRVETNRNFTTKLWNAARFCEMNNCVTDPNFDPAKVTQTVNRWIVAETKDVAAAASGHIEALRFNTAVARLMEMANALIAAAVRPRAAVETFVLLLSPFAPDELL